MPLELDLFSEYDNWIWHWCIQLCTVCLGVPALIALSRDLSGAHLSDDQAVGLILDELSCSQGCFEYRLDSVAQVCAQEYLKSFRPSSLLTRCVCKMVWVSGRQFFSVVICMEMLWMMYGDLDSAIYVCANLDCPDAYWELGYLAQMSALQTETWVQLNQSGGELHSHFLSVSWTFSSEPFHEMHLYSEVVGTLEILDSTKRVGRHTSGFLGHLLEFSSNLVVNEEENDWCSSNDNEIPAVRQTPVFIYTYRRTHIHTPHSF